MLDLSVSLWWYAGIDVPGGQRLAELVTVIALVGNQGVGGRQAGIEQLGSCMITHLTFG
jgi:hypothetical protein